MTDFSGGYTGNILRIDLNNRRVIKQKLDAELADKFIGGRGLNLKYLYDEIQPGIDPLGPENKIIIGTGPCNGTLVPGSQRFTATAKSPLTGFIGDSNSGGDFGAELKYAGYDMIIIEGQSKVPVYLYINNDQVELREAADFWGKTTIETRIALSQVVREPEACTISIGPAGENLVRIASVIADMGRSLGRAGIGAVFGSKKLKAIVVKGSQGVKVANYKMLKELARKNFEAWQEDPVSYERWSKWGTTGSWMRYIDHGMLSTRNFQRGTFEKNLFEPLKDLFVKQVACTSCPLGCNHVFVIPKGDYAKSHGEAVEMSALGDAGPKIGNDDTAMCLKVHSLCDEYGIDLLDITGIIAWVFDCADRGILTSSDVDGLKLEWGNASTILKLIEMTARRQGFGDILSQGLVRASEIIGRGSGKYAMHVKGQGLVMREPRASKGWGLGYAVSSRGACHMRNCPPEGGPAEGPSVQGSRKGTWEPELLKQVAGYRDPTNPITEEGKPEIIKWYEELRAFQNSMEICIFPCYFGIAKVGEVPFPELLARFYNAVTGRNLTGKEAMETGERIVNLERAFNLQEGLSRKDDSLPERMLKEPMPDGPARGQVVNLEPMIDKYYEIRGWDIHSGFPTRQKLLQLGLDDIAIELEKIGKLAE